MAQIDEIKEFSCRMLEDVMNAAGSIDTNEPVEIEFPDNLPTDTSAGLKFVYESLIDEVIAECEVFYDPHHGYRGRVFLVDKFKQETWDFFYCDGVLYPPNEDKSFKC
jgi:hypothetical protein